MRHTVLVDMDGIVVGLTQHWLAQIYEEHDIKVGMDEIDEWGLHNCGGLVHLGAERVYAYLQRPGFFRHAPALPGAVQALKGLHDLGFNVVICSSPSGPVSAKEKFEWLEEHTPFISPKNVILANQKTLVRGDVLIDDHPETIVEYRKAWPHALVLGIEYEYNRATVQTPMLKLFKGYEDTAAAWAGIFEAVLSHPA